MPLLTVSLFAATLNLAMPSGDWGLASGNSDCDATDVDFSDAKHGFATCTIGRVMTSADGGRTWAIFDTGLDQSLMFAHTDGPTKLIASRLGYYRSDDGGVTWQERGDLGADRSNSVFDVAFLPSERRVAIKGSALLFSDDDGDSWKVGFPSRFNVFFKELHFPDGPVGFATGGITYDGGSFASVARSDDAGSSWTLLPFAHGEITAADFFDADHGVVATMGAKLYTTANSGASWELLGEVPDDGILVDLVHRGDLHWYAVSFQGCLYESFDAGGNWSTAYCDPQGRGLVALTTRSGSTVAVGKGVVLYQKDVLFRDGFD